MKARHALLAVAALSMPALSAFAQPNQAFLVQLTLTDGGRVIGRPSITLRQGSIGRILLPGTYDVSLTVRPTSDGSSPVALTTEVSLPVDGQLVPAARPSFSMELDRAVSAELVSPATARPLRIEATVSRVPS